MILWILLFTLPTLFLASFAVSACMLSSDISRAEAASGCDVQPAAAPAGLPVVPSTPTVVVE